MNYYATNNTWDGSFFAGRVGSYSSGITITATASGSTASLGSTVSSGQSGYDSRRTASDSSHTYYRLTNSVGGGSGSTYGIGSTTYNTHVVGLAAGSPSTYPNNSTNSAVTVTSYTSTIGSESVSTETLATHYNLLVTYTSSFRVYFDETNSSYDGDSADPAEPFNTDEWTQQTAVFAVPPCSYVHPNTFLDRLETYSITESVGPSQTMVSTGAGQLTVVYPSTSYSTYEDNELGAAAGNELTGTGSQASYYTVASYRVEALRPLKDSIYYFDDLYSGRSPIAWVLNDIAGTSACGAFTDLYHSVGAGFTKVASARTSESSFSIGNYTYGGGSTNGIAYATSDVTKETYTNTFNLGVRKSFASGYNYGNPSRPFTTSSVTLALTTSFTATKALWAYSYTTITSFLSYGEFDVVTLISVGTPNSDGYYHYLGLQKTTIKKSSAVPATFSSTGWLVGQGLLNYSSNATFTNGGSQGTVWTADASLTSSTYSSFGVGPVANPNVGVALGGGGNYLLGRAAANGYLGFNTSYEPTTGPVYSSYATGVAASSGDAIDFGASPPVIYIAGYPMMQRNGGCKVSPTEDIVLYGGGLVSYSVIPISGPAAAVSVLATYLSTASGATASNQQVTYTVALEGAVGGEFWTSSQLKQYTDYADRGLNNPHESYFFVDGGDNKIGAHEVYMNVGKAAVSNGGNYSNTLGTVSFTVPAGSTFKVYAEDLIYISTVNSPNLVIDAFLYQEFLPYNTYNQLY